MYRAASRPSWRHSANPLKRAYARSPVAQGSSVLLGLLLLAALLAPWLARYDPFDPANLILLDAFTPPGQESLLGQRYVLGADDQGRDVLSAVLYGLRISLLVGVAAVALSLLIGLPLGLLAGYVGGWVDALIMRLADIQLTFPVILVALMIFGLARSLLPAALRDEQALLVIILAIALSDWVQYARLIRAAVRVEIQKDYIAAAQLIGRSHTAIVCRHLLPNLMAPVLVLAAISFAQAIVTESTLSFLGVGLPATQPSLGTLIRIGQGYLFSGEWWILGFPALTLLLLALAVNLLSDCLREALSPYQP